MVLIRADDTAFWHMEEPDVKWDPQARSCSQQQGSKGTCLLPLCCFSRCLSESPQLVGIRVLFNRG